MIDFLVDIAAKVEKCVIEEKAIFRAHAVGMRRTEALLNKAVPIFAAALSDPKQFRLEESTPFLGTSLLHAIPLDGGKRLQFGTYCGSRTRPAKKIKITIDNGGWVIYRTPGGRKLGRLRLPLKSYIHGWGTSDPASAKWGLGSVTLTEEEEKAIEAAVADL